MITTAQIFTLLFLMLGPFKVLEPYARITRNATPSVARKIALQGTLYASAALLLAAVLGQRILQSYSIPLPVLKLAAGVILFLVALLAILRQFATAAPHEAEVASPTPAMAMNPLAFPAIVTPYGIAAVITFIAIAPDLRAQLMVGGIVLVIMVMNLVVMLVSRSIFKVLAVILPILAAVLGIVQVALGLEIIHRTLGELQAM